MQEPSSLQASYSANSIHSTIDLNALRLPQNFGEGFAVKRLITRIPVRKPSKYEFFRVQSKEDFRLQAMILEKKEEAETYLVSPDMASVVPELQRPATLLTAIDTRGNVFLIPVPLPGPDGRINSWHQSLHSVTSTAEKSWVRSVANMTQKSYDIFVPQGYIAEPKWPDMTFQEIIEIAFRDRVISSPDHPVIRQLLGYQ